MNLAAGLADILYSVPPGIGVVSIVRSRGHPGKPGARASYIYRSRGHPGKPGAGASYIYRSRGHP